MMTSPAEASAMTAIAQMGTMDIDVLAKQMDTQDSMVVMMEGSTKSTTGLAASGADLADATQTIDMDMVTAIALHFETPTRANLARRRSLHIP